MNGNTKSNHWREIERIFDAALEIETDRRAAFVAEACAADAALRGEVESLLAAYSEAGDFLASHAERAAAVKQTARNGDKPANGFHASTPDERIRPYRLLRELAVGGMGAVWLAERADAQFDQQVAIKLLKADAAGPDLLHRFRHERQILASLNHPNIARLLDGGTTADGRPYIVMEYIEGLPIDEYCRRHQLSIHERLTLFRTVCAAVHYAHQNLLVHRDLKPGNILVTADGVPKLLDFGIAKLLQPDLTKSYDTITGLNPMTPAYASPEQVRGEKLTTASDVYSLGVVLYELLTGHSPYRLQANTFSELVKAICEQEPERPSTTARSSAFRRSPSGDGEEARLKAELQTPSVPPSALRGDVDSIVLMALRKEPQARYGSVEQFSEDIRRYLDGLPTIARKGTFGYRAAKYLRRNRIPVAAAALILLSLLGGIFATWRQVVIARASQVRAETALTTAEERKQQAEVARNEANQQRTDAEVQRTAAEEQRQLAEEQTVLADEQRSRAEQGEETKRQFLYSAQMKLAHQAWEAANIERMQELLDAQLPQPGQQDLRGFEWYYLWRLAHSDLVTLKHAESVVSIVLAPDGTKMASQTLGGDIRIWDIATGKELQPIHDGETNATCMVISPDGKFFAQGEKSGQVRIYAVSNGARLSTLECSQQEITAIAFSPDGKSLAASAFDGVTGIWTVPSWRRQSNFRASTRLIRTVVFTPDSKQLLTGGAEGLVKAWNPLSGQELKILPNNPQISKMAFIPGSNNLVVGYWNGSLTRVYDFATGRQLGEIKTTLGGARWLALLTAG